MGFFGPNYNSSQTFKSAKSTRVLWTRLHLKSCKKGGCTLNPLVASQGTPFWPAATSSYLCKIKRNKSDKKTQMQYYESAFPKDDLEFALVASAVHKMALRKVHGKGLHWRNALLAMWYPQTDECWSCQYQTWQADEQNQGPSRPHQAQWQHLSHCRQLTQSANGMTVHPMIWVCFLHLEPVIYKANL